MKQKILTLFLIFGLSLPLAAQMSHEFSANIGGGLSTLDYKPANGKFTGGFGGEAGLGYHLFFMPNWAISTGVNVALYNAQASTANYSQRMSATSSGGTTFDFSYAYTNYKEDLSSVMITVPLMLQFQMPGKLGFYAAAGAKIGFPVSSKCTTSGDLSTNGYFTGTNTTYSEDLPMKGFGNYPGINQSNDMKLKMAFMLSAEAGVKWQLAEWRYLYAGLYVDYGLNNINNSNSSSALLTYNGRATNYPAGFNYGSMAGMSDKIAPLAIGIKIRFSLGFPIESKHSSDNVIVQ